MAYEKHAKMKKKFHATYLAIADYNLPFLQKTIIHIRQKYKDKKKKEKEKEKEKKEKIKKYIEKEKKYQFVHVIIRNPGWDMCN